MSALLRARDAITPQLTEDEHFELEGLLQSYFDDVEPIVTFALDRDSSDEVRAMCEDVRSIVASG